MLGPLLCQLMQLDFMFRKLVNKGNLCYVEIQGKYGVALLFRGGKS